jgi:hypothetical protein
LALERPAPIAGRHTQEMMLELGYDDPTIDDQQVRGIVRGPDEDYEWPV